VKQDDVGMTVVTGIKPNNNHVLTQTRVCREYYLELDNIINDINSID
jgi:hypothetical protein